MRKITQAAIDKLLNDPRDPSVTIYMPTHVSAAPPNMNEDQIRFKNLYRRAVELLNSRDEHDPFNQFFADNCEKLLADTEFWAGTTQSLLICARPDETFEYYHLPIDSDEYLAVDQHFHLAPVLALLNDFRPYYVLTVTQQEPMLFQGDRYGLSESDVELPESLREALNIDEMNRRNLQFHSNDGNPAGANFHGHGGSKDTSQELRFKYYRLIDEHLHSALDNQHPLILTGAVAEVADYRQLSRYPNIAEGYIQGDQRDTSLQDLHDKAQAIIQQEMVIAEHLQAAERYEELKGSSPDRVADTVASIQAAAASGRVDTLMIGLSSLSSDTVRDNDYGVLKLTFPGEAAAAAIDQLARQVWHQGGKIVNMLDEHMPQKQSALAVLRY